MEKNNARAIWAQGLPEYAHRYDLGTGQVIDKQIEVVNE
jgi:hypothetical protein